LEPRRDERPEIPDSHDDADDARRINLAANLRTAHTILTEPMATLMSSCVMSSGVITTATFSSLVGKIKSPSSVTHGCSRTSSSVMRVDGFLSIIRLRRFRSAGSAAADGTPGAIGGGGVQSGSSLQMERYSSMTFLPRNGTFPYAMQYRHTPKEYTSAARPDAVPDGDRKRVAVTPGDEGACSDLPAPDSGDKMEIEPGLLLGDSEPSRHSSGAMNAGEPAVVDTASREANILGPRSG
jgi:hypothetical protein